MIDTQNNRSIEFHQRRFISAFSLLGISTFLIFGLVNLARQDFLLGGLELVFSAILALVVVYLHITKRINQAGTAILIILWLSLLALLWQGGIEKTGMLWFVTFPLLAFYVKTTRNAFYWIVGFLISLILSVIFDAFFPFNLAFTFIEVRQLLASLVVMSLISYFYSAMNNAHMQNDIEQVQLLDKVNKQIKHELEAKELAEKQLKELLEKTSSQNEYLEETRKAMVNILEDIEAEKNNTLLARNEVEAQRQRLHIALRAGEIGTWDWNITTSALEWDEFMYKLYKVKKEDFTGHITDFQKYVHKDDQPALNEDIQLAIREHKDLQHTFRITRGDSQVRYIKVFAQIYIHPTSNEKHMIGVNLDVTKEKEFEVSLERFKLAVENASDHIVITDTEGVVLFANQAVENTTGYRLSEVIGKTPALWGKQMDKEFYVNMWHVIKDQKKVFRGEVKNKRKSGAEYTAEVTISPVLDENDEVLYFVGIERDVTRAKEIDRMKTEFISLASHQLRTPLSAIKWFVEMLMDGDAGPLNKEQMDFVQNVKDSSDRMIDLINSLLNISRIESGRIIIDPQPTYLKQLIETVLTDVNALALEHEHKLAISIPDDIPEIKIDAKLTSQVYSNLITNAIKYTPKGGTISIKVWVDGDEVISEIKDSGYGIPNKDHGRVFEKFFRAENVVKEVTDGTGLGLYLVKAIVESSQGKIWFESEEGHGTTFWFSLPLAGVQSKKGEVGIAE